MEIEKIKKVEELSSLIITHKENIKLIETSNCLMFTSDGREASDSITLTESKDTEDIISSAKKAAIAYIEKKISEWETKLEEILK